MNTFHLNHELLAIQSRTQKFMGASGLLHLMFFLLLYLMPTITPGPERLVEISWIDPVKIIPATAKTTSLPTVKEILQKSSANKVKEHFVRDLVRADIAPLPQSEIVAEDKLNNRLVALQRAAVEKQVQIAAIAAPNTVTSSVLAGITAKENNAGRVEELARQQTGNTQPVELQRAPVKTSNPVIAKVKVPEVEKRSEPAKSTDNVASRTLAGASLTGPVADRPISYYRRPLYPDWAKREGVEGSSTIYFVVLPDGRIKESVVVQKTSGFEDFDRNAIDAILDWRFEPLKGAVTGEQWGTITFHYRLNSTRSN